VRLCAGPGDWEFFDVDAALCRGFWGVPGVRKYRAKDPAGGVAMGFAAETGAFAKKEFAGQRVSCDSDSFRRFFEGSGPGKAVLFRARATDEFTKKVEVVFVHADGGEWGIDLPLAPEWRTIRVPMKDLRPYWRTRRGDGTAPDMRKVQVISFGYGRWLYEGTLDKPHGYELSSIKAEF
jgi:hypothetical protein